MACAAAADSDEMKPVVSMLIGFAVTMLFTAGCGGGEESSGTATAASSGSGTVAVTMGNPSEYAMTLAPAESAAGKVTFEVKNEGTIVHEMVVIKTDEGAGNLSTDGEADETGAVDEVADLPPGESKALELDLEPGKYALVCNLPGHYAAGMYADFTVK